MIKKIFISGLITILPVAATVYIVIVSVTLIENFLGHFVRNLLPDGFYFTGSGFIATLVLIFICGLLVNNLITAAIINKIQAKLSEVPIVNAVYMPLRDLINLFSKGPGENSPQKVVLVKISENLNVVGLVTREDFKDLGTQLSQLNDYIAVLFPISYGLGGHTFLVNKKCIEPLDMTVEKAMRLAVTGWIKTDSPLIK